MIRPIRKQLDKLKEQPCVTVRDYIRCAKPMIGQTYYDIYSWDGKSDVTAVTVFKISDAGNIFYRVTGEKGHKYNYIKACVHSWYATEKEATEAKLKRLKADYEHYADVAKETRKRHARLLRRYKKQKTTEEDNETTKS
jgi:hypothetical protein